MPKRRPRASSEARIQPNSPAFSLIGRTAIKAAALSRGVRRGAPPRMATFPPAHALVIPLLGNLHPPQAPTISRIVTTGERVGRTMEASASDERRDDMMNTSVNQGSAKIYQFPVGGRAALAGRRNSETRTVVDAPSIADCSSTGVWSKRGASEKGSTR